MSVPLRDRCFAELAGTAILVGAGTGSIVSGAAVGGWPQWLLALSWFGAVALPIQAFAYVSGAHLNPAVTLGLVGARRFPPGEAPWFLVAQVAGGFLGSLAVLVLLGPQDHLGATLPGPAGPVWVFPLEFTGAFALVGSVLHLTGLGRAPRRTELLLPAGVVGLATFLIGPWTGCSLNPVRSLAPAVLSGDVTWLWLYFVATAAGTFAAVAVWRVHPRRTARRAPDL